MLSSYQLPQGYMSILDPLVNWQSEVLAFFWNGRRVDACLTSGSKMFQRVRAMGGREAKNACHSLFNFIICLIHTKMNFISACVPLMKSASMNQIPKSIEVKILKERERKNVEENK